ncbi:rod shape determining protein RodA [Cnuella takakiae]|uniref:Cell wall polymerase n=1 Tax=Cnuella takakiae TaxID=1302690 RepID=A0A1M4ZIZ5_9BACT|nr:rod shape-determining protein RodA [Cnuella takakiae]OLY94196.1 cell cycle protein [Cnuella takakiae]SHF17981.1 rod shape determining protein RodA [Cnuella takakiae]
MSRNQPLISKGVDTLMIWLYLLLVGIGILAIFAVTYREGDPVAGSFLSFKTDYSKQLFYFVLAAIIGVFILVTDSKFFTATANIWYAFGILLMLLVFPFHSNVKGTESIIRFGGFQFQPAEFCKVSVCLALSKYLSRPDTDFTKGRSQLIAAAIAISPALLSILQSETGLALVYFAFFLVMYREGLPPTILVIGFSVAVLVIATILMEPNTLAIILTVIAGLAAWVMRRQIRRRKSVLVSLVAIWLLCVGIQRFAVPFIFQNVLQKHQVERIFTLFGKENPYTGIPGELVEAGAKKEGVSDYNVKQSKIAIGSGGLLGKGLLNGTQTRYDFVPEQRTDFIFCTIGEGFGFVGTTLLLLIYLFLLFRIVIVAERQRSAFSRVYAYGVASVFFFHIGINVAMTVGLAPVIGIPLPFISYGGTALITFTILLFILIRLDADRQMVLR